MAGVVTTTTVLARTVWGTKRVVLAKLAFDTGDYADGGIAVTAAQFGLTSIDAVIPQGASFSASLANVAAWDQSASKIVMFECGADGDMLDEKPAEAMTATTLYVTVIGA